MSETIGLAVTHEQSDKRERLAEYAHEAWSGWIKYMFGKSVLTFEDGSIVIPANLRYRWQRQANTNYIDLPESEKESDRAEADKMLTIIGEHPTAVEWYEDRIEDIIVEFGEYDPAACLATIIHHIQLMRHCRAHPNAERVD